MSVTNSHKFKRIVELEIKELKKERDNPEQEKVQDQKSNASENITKRDETWVEKVKNGEMKIFNRNGTLNQKYQIKSAGNHLYLIGMSFHSLGEKKRLVFHNPWYNLFIIITVMTRFLLSFIIPHNYRSFHVLIADFSDVLGIKFHLNPAFILLLSAIVFSMLLNLKHYIRGQQPEYLRLFGLFTGQSLPDNLRLKDEKSVKMLIKILRNGITFINVYAINILIFGVLLNFFPLIASYKLYELILFGIPWTIVFSTGLYFACKIYFYQILYFFITCLYLKLKLKQLNEEIKSKTKFKSRRFGQILDLLKKLNAIYEEIDSYNRIYWSKITLITIGTITFSSDLWIFVSIYAELNPVLRVLFSFFASAAILLFILYLKINSMVFNESFKAYTLINNLYLEYNAWSLPISLNFKVSSN